MWRDSASLQIEQRIIISEITNDKSRSEEVIVMTITNMLSATAWRQCEPWTT